MNNTARALNYANTFEDIKKMGGNTAQIISSITLSSVKEIKDAIEFYDNEINFSNDDDYKTICNNQKDLLLRIMIAKVRLTADLLNISGVTGDIEKDLADLPTITVDDIKANKAFDKEAIIEERKNKGKVKDMKGNTISTFDNTKKETKTEVKTEDKKDNQLSQKEIGDKILSMLRNPSVVDHDILKFMRLTLGKADYIGDKNMSKEVVPARKWSEREIQTYFNGLKKQVIEENLKIKDEAKETKEEKVKVIPMDDSLKDVKPEVKVDEKKEVEPVKEETTIPKFQDIYEEGKKKILDNAPIAEVMAWFVALVLANKVPSIKLKENTEFEAKTIFYSIFSSTFNVKQQDEAKAVFYSIFSSTFNVKQQGEVKAVVDALKRKEAEKWNDEAISADLIEVAKSLDYKEDKSFAKICKKLRTKYNPLNQENKISITDIKDQLQPLVKEHNTAYWESYQKLRDSLVPLAEKAEITAKEEKKSDSPSEEKDSSSEKKAEELKKEVVETGNPTIQEKTTSSEEVTSQKETKVEDKKEEAPSPETKNDIPEQKADTPAATPSENVQAASKEEAKSMDVQPEKSSENTDSEKKAEVVVEAETDISKEEKEEETTEKTELNSEFEAILLSKDKKEFQKGILDYLLASEIETTDGDKEVDKTKLSMLVTAIMDRTQSNLYGKYARRVSKNNKADMYRMVNNIYNNFKQS